MSWRSTNNKSCLCCQCGCFLKRLWQSEDKRSTIQDVSDQRIELYVFVRHASKWPFEARLRLFGRRCGDKMLEGVFEAHSLCFLPLIPDNASAGAPNMSKLMSFCSGRHLITNLVTSFCGGAYQAQFITLSYSLSRDRYLLYKGMSDSIWPKRSRQNVGMCEWSYLLP